jgi:hypothetical protein
MAVALVVVARDVMGRRSLDRAVIQAVIVQGDHQDAAATNIACVARLGTRPGSVTARPNAKNKPMWLKMMNTR